MSNEVLLILSASLMIGGITYLVWVAAKLGIYIPIISRGARPLTTGPSVATSSAIGRQVELQLPMFTESVGSIDATCGARLTVTGILVARTVSPAGQVSYVLRMLDESLDAEDPLRGRLEITLLAESQSPRRDPIEEAIATSSRVDVLIPLKATSLIHLHSGPARRAVLRPLV